MLRHLSRLAKARVMSGDIHRICACDRLAAVSKLEYNQLQKFMYSTSNGSIKSMNLVSSSYLCKTLGGTTKFSSTAGSFNSVKRSAVDPLEGFTSGKSIEDPVIQAVNPDDMIPGFNAFYVEKGAIASVHDYPEGGYVDIDSADLDKFMPEGLAGDADDDFQFMKRRAWMIRDSSKLLFHIIEEHEAKFLGNPSAVANLTQSFQTPVNLPGFTDRKEWLNAGMKVYRHEKVLPQPERLTKGGLKALKGPGSISYEYMSTLKDDLPDKILLQGERGVGKSYVLNQAVLYARQRGWVCLFIPNGWDHAQSGYYIEPCTLQPATPNAPPLFDNPIMSVKALRDFWYAHGSLMATLPIKNTNVVAKYQDYIDRNKDGAKRIMGVKGREKLSFIEMRSLLEEDDNIPDEDEMDEDILEHFDFLTKEYKTLEDLIQLGIAFRDLSGSVFMDLVQELRGLDKHLILFAVDQLNAWDAKSAFQYEHKNIIGRDLCVPRALSFISQKRADSNNWTAKNGLCIAALSFKHNEGHQHKITYESSRGSVPLSIKIPAYNQVEFLSHMAYYVQMRLISNHASVSLLASFRMFANSIPGTMRRQVLDFYLMRELALCEDKDEHLSDENLIEEVKKELKAENEEYDPEDDKWMEEVNSDISEAANASEEDFILLDNYNRDLAFDDDLNPIGQEEDDDGKSIGGEDESDLAEDSDSEEKKNSKQNKRGAKGKPVKKR